VDLAEVVDAPEDGEVGIDASEVGGGADGGEVAAVGGEREGDDVGERAALEHLAGGPVVDEHFTGEADDDAVAADADDPVAGPLPEERVAWAVEADRALGVGGAVLLVVLVVPAVVAEMATWAIA
jgi:hypothetical protein